MSEHPDPCGACAFMSLMLSEGCRFRDQSEFAGLLHRMFEPLEQARERKRELRYLLELFEPWSREIGAAMVLAGATPESTLRFAERIRRELAPATPTVQ